MTATDTYGMATGSAEAEGQDLVPQEHAVILDGDDPNLESLLPNSATKKKKKQKKPQSQRGLNKPTGMEEFFADSPMTPAQYEEIKKIYDTDVPFLE